MVQRIGSMVQRIGTTIADSTPHFDPLPRPPRGAPNVVLVVLDDLGFAQLGCFGSDIATPNIDALATNGLRYNRFHVTALCSPTRACLLTGRNHHAVGMGFLTDVPTGFPGYTGRIPRSAATLARILRDTGYSTFAVGKWHLTPRWEEHASGPFERWPLGLGFERFYGFLGGDTNQYAPELVRDNGFIAPPRPPDDGYHLTEDLADQAIRLVLDQQQCTPAKPFFLYFATGAMHAPHHVAPEWSDRYRGRFDAGWESWRAAAFARQQDLGVVPPGTVMPPRPPWVQDWDSLSADERHLFARMMEVFAGYLEHTDAQIGRVLDSLRALGVLDDTVVVVLSDNGTSAEGGPIGSFNEHRFTHDRVDDFAETFARIDELGGHRAYNHYPWGWAWAGNAPFRLWKRYTWLGGVRTPLVVHWPRGITATGEVRDPFCHAVDVMPTLLDVVGVTAPAEVDGVAQQPIDGVSLRPSFDQADATPARSTQYFEMLGSRAIYHDGWKATTDHIGNQLSVERELVAGSNDFDDDTWELFDLAADFAEAHDVSAEHPELRDRLVARWWAEAGRNQVLPIDDSLIGRVVALEPPPYGLRARAVLRPGGGGVAEDALPPLGAGFDLVARVEAGGAAGGVLAALGDWHNGFALYVLEGVPVFAISLFGALTRLAAPASLPPGACTIALRYRRGASPGGPITLLVDGTAVAEVELREDLPFRWQIGGAGLRVGRDTGFPVCDDYRPPFPFSGTLHEVTLESTVLVASDPAAEAAAALRRE